MRAFASRWLGVFAATALLCVPSPHSPPAGESGASPVGGTEAVAPTGTTRPVIGASAAVAAHAAAAPTLVVLVTVDQMRADYLDRFAPLLRGGLDRLARGGARFTDAHQDHAITETAPGHSTLLSGRFPRSTGIIDNAEGVQDDRFPLIAGAPGAGASPERFRGTVLVDWLRARDRRARQLSVSGKDRGAILPAGRAKAEVFWYARDGRFTTSRWYADTLPTWVQDVNARDDARRRAGTAWTLLLSDSAYPEPDDVPIEGAGQANVFPHQLPADSAAAAAYLPATPFEDELVLQLALEGVRATGLGAGPATDILSISLSVTDAVGHLYGPDSREMHDQILRLDRSLATFLDSLLVLRDSSRVMVVLTADHGIGTIPELVPPTVRPRPVRLDPAVVLAPLRAALASRGANPDAVYFDGRFVIADDAALRRATLSPDSVLEAFAATLRQQPGVERVDRFATLSRHDPDRDATARRWLHQLPAGAPVEFVVTLTPYSLATQQVDTHGSPHDYDSHVPLLFWGAGVRPGRHAEFVRTVDIAPTIAELLGVRPGERLDGRALRGVWAR